VFCRTANSLGSTAVVRYLFNEMKQHGILIVYCITKWPFISRREQLELFIEAKGLLGGTPRLIFGGRACECEVKKSYIVPVNSFADETSDGVLIGRHNISTLRQIIVTKLDEGSQAKLVELYRNNLGFWRRAGFWCVELLEDVTNVGAMEALLTPEETEIYRRLKQQTGSQQQLVDLIERVLKRGSGTT